MNLQVIRSLSVWQPQSHPAGDFASDPNGMDIVKLSKDVLFSTDIKPNQAGLGSSSMRRNSLEKRP
jgi:hypothetical protein